MANRTVDQIVEQLETPIGKAPNPQDAKMAPRVEFARQFVERALRQCAIIAKEVLYVNGYAKAAQEFNWNDQTMVKLLYDLAMHIAEDTSVGVESKWEERKNIEDIAIRVKELENTR
ncbi:MAG: hypothetical protein HQK96_08310 [Nitrospirae bacterium]|nr:hypothetical protein [Nitrospirota bacterium]